MNADEFQGQALVDEAFEAELIAYSRLCRYAVRRESENCDAEEVLAQSVAGDAAVVLWTARVMIELYGTGAADHANHRARLKDDAADSFSASMWRCVALTIEEMGRALNDTTSNSLPLQLYSAKLP